MLRRVSSPFSNYPLFCRMFGIPVGIRPFLRPVKFNSFKSKAMNKQMILCRRIFRGHFVPAVMGIVAMMGGIESEPNLN